MDDIRRCGATGNQADDLTFRKHGTHAGNGHIVVPVQAKLAHLRQLHLQGAGHHLQKTAGTGGAFVVHRKGFNSAAFAQADHLGILPANVDHGAHGGVQMMSPAGMAGDLGHGCAVIAQELAPVAGVYLGTQVAFGNACHRQGLFQCLAGAGCSPGAGGHNGPAADLSAAIQDHGIGAGRAAVDAGGILCVGVHGGGLLVFGIGNGVQAFGKCAQAGAQLPAAAGKGLAGTVGFNF